MVDAFVGTDNYKAGQLAGEQLVADFPEGGDIAVLDYPANTAAVDRAKGFLDAIEGKGFHVAAQLDGQGNTETALSQAEDILQANSNLVAFFGINDDSALGAYAAVSAANEEVAVYGALRKGKKRWRRMESLKQPPRSLLSIWENRAQRWHIRFYAARNLKRMYPLSRF